MMTTSITQNTLPQALNLLADRLRESDAPIIRLVVCSGAALVGAGLAVRATNDVDVLAFLDGQNALAAPVPWPQPLAHAADETARILSLPLEWLNNRPSAGPGGLFQMGLPEGLKERLISGLSEKRLQVYFIGRLDQIHLKLFAAVDRGGYHITDLLALSPNDSELLAAARWTLTVDASEGYAQLLRQLLEELGHAAVARQL